MNSVSLLIMNFEEVRRRSIKVWEAIPYHMLDWRPDKDALSFAQMIMHVLDSEYYYHQMLIHRGSVSESDLISPYTKRNFTTLDGELIFATPYRQNFIDYVASFSSQDLENIQIDRSDVGYVRSLGDMLLRIAYHESVHTGQMLDYMRTAGIDRPKIWD